MVNNPQFDNLPPIKLIHIQDQAPSTLQGQSRSKARKTSLPTDIRWLKLLEFLRSTNLALNSRKLYERELKRFLGWTQLHYHELRPRHLGLYGVDPSHARKLTGHQSEKAFRRYTLRSEQEAAIAAYYRAIGEQAE